MTLISLVDLTGIIHRHPRCQIVKGLYPIILGIPGRK